MPPIFTIEKREEILNRLLRVGIEMIKEYGIRKMSIDKITGSAGIGKGTFYHFFSSKEEYVLKVIQYSKEKIYTYINQIVQEKGGLDKQAFIQCLDKFTFFKTSDDLENQNIITYMTSDDEAWLKEKFPDQIITSEEREQKIMHTIFSYTVGLKENIDYHIVSNMMKIMAITAMNKQVLHQEVLEQNIKIMIKSMCDYIFES